MRSHIDLFSGIGGFALAARWAGITTVQFVEIDPFCQKVLQKNFPGVPIHDDIKTFTNTNWDRLQEQGAEQQTGGDRQLFQNQPFLLTGGFPCQPFSCAGKRRGKEDDRYLWEEMLRVIKEFKPTWIIGENVNGIRSMEFQDGVSDLEGDTVIQEDGNGDYTNVLDGICDSLEAIGYEVQPIIIPACAVNAPHRRDRVWIVANRRCEHGERAEVNGELNRPLPCEKNAPLLKRPNSDDGKGINSYTSGAGYSGTTWEGSARKEGQPDGHPTECVCDAPDSTQREDDGRDGRIVDAPEECGECGDTSAIIGDQFTTDSCEQCDATDINNQGLQGCEKAGNIGIDWNESRNEQFGRYTCWEEPWIEVATRLCRIPHGLSEWMDENWRRINGTTSKTISKQEVSDMWDYFQSDEIQRNIRGQFPLLKKNDLLTVLCKLKAESNTQDSIPFEGKAIQEGYLRELSNQDGVGCSPQGREYKKQQRGQYNDALPPLPYEIALAAESIIRWHKLETDSANRVDRLKSLGNAIVPQVAFAIMQAIIEVDNETKKNTQANP